MLSACDRLMLHPVYCDDVMYAVAVFICTPRLHPVRALPSSTRFKRRRMNESPNIRVVETTGGSRGVRYDWCVVLGERISPWSVETTDH